MDLENIVVDITQRNYNTIQTIQYDVDSRYVNVKIVSSGKNVDLTNYMVSIACKKPDGKIVFNETEMVEPKQGLIKFLISEQISVALGEVVCELKIYGKSSSVLTTQYFTINVTKPIADKTIQSTNEFRQLTIAMNDYNKWNGKFEEKYNGLEEEYAEELSGVKSGLEETNSHLSENMHQVSTIKTELAVVKANSKYMLELYCGDVARQTTDYVTNHIKKGKESGFNEICLLIYLQSDGSTLEDISRFEEYNQIANDLGMPITCLKLHGSYKYPNYLSTLYSGLSKLPNVNTVFIFNEQFKEVYKNGLDYPVQIKLNYPQVKKVGCTVDYGTAFKYWTPNSSDEINILQTKYDILGVHMYPSCGSYNEARSTTYEQCIKAFDEFELLIPWENEIWLTESGVLPYWQFLELPENYTVANLSDKERTIDPQRLFYRALFNCKFSQRAKIIIPWYTESWNYSDTIGMWEVIRHIIKNS